MRKIKREDTVIVLHGKDRGKTGVVRAIVGGGETIKRKGKRPKVKEDKVFVTGLNISKRHQRAQGQTAATQAGIIEKEMPMPLAKVMLVCKNCNKPARVGFGVRGDGRKHRVCRNCGQDID
jgi:large subunit ribosomal protein L24